MKCEFNSRHPVQNSQAAIERSAGFPKPSSQARLLGGLPKFDGFMYALVSPIDSIRLFRTKTKMPNADMFVYGYSSGGELGFDGMVHV